MSGAEITGVTGGTGSRDAAAELAATYDAVRALADVYDRTGSELREWAALDARTLVDPDLAESAVLAPLTFARVEASVVAATTGPDGLLPESAGWEADAIAVRGVLLALHSTDAAVEHALDRAAGALLWTGALTLLLAAPRLPPAARDDMEQLLIDHPGLVEHAVNGGLGIFPGVGAGAGTLAMLYGPQRGPEVHDVTEAAGPVPGDDTPPDDLEGLIDHLQEVADLSPDPDSALNGTIEIQTLGCGEDVRHIVYLPGTDDMTTLPGLQDGDVRDFATDLHSLAGDQTAYQQGILDAMHQAGIDPHDPVLLVGHSLGGMEAAAILSHGSEFDVTNVVTAGSPTAHLDGFPDGSHVLSLEHHGDVVPLLDGHPNPSSVEQTTITFVDDDVDGGGIAAQHDYPHYLAGAAAADASGDPAVQEQLASLEGHGFLAAGESVAPPAEVHVFQVVREP
jgi:hypothetical protein